MLFVSTITQSYRALRLSPTRDFKRPGDRLSKTFLYLKCFLIESFFVNFLCENCVKISDSDGDIRAIAKKCSSRVTLVIDRIEIQEYITKDLCRTSARLLFASGLFSGLQ